jgi:hypothetical protein
MYGEQSNRVAAEREAEVCTVNCEGKKDGVRSRKKMASVPVAYI